jgi:uncharacterized membrane protein
MPTLSPEHLHPILVNFTAALVPASLASDVAGRAFNKQSLHNAAWWMLVYAAAITPFTATAGLMWRRAVGDALPQEMIRRHQALGITLVVLLAVLATWRWRIFKRDLTPSIYYLGFAVIVVLALVYQGTLGGELAFGP